MVELVYYSWGFVVLLILIFVECFDIVSGMIGGESFGMKVIICGVG